MNAKAWANSAVEIVRALAPTTEVRSLIEELDRELAENYPPEQQHGLSVEAIFHPNVRFFVARRDGSAVGCGGIALFTDFAEIKRMYVRPSERGRGVADAIIARLEMEAMAAGLPVLRLETGTRQTAAIRFYERRGFNTCEAFQPYSSLPPHAVAASVFLEKQLSAT